MLKKLLCILGAGVMLFSFASCNSDSGKEETTSAEPETVFEEYVVAKEVFDKSATVLEELVTVDGTTYELVEYNGKKSIAAKTPQNNYRVYHEFEGEFEILSEANKRTDSSYIYFMENPESNTKKSLKAFYAKNSTVVTFVKAPCTDLVLLNVPESYEIYPYGMIAQGNQLMVIDLKDASSSSYSRTLEELGMFFETPASFFAQGKNGAYTYTELEAISRTHVKASVFNVKSNGSEKLTAEFTFNPINGVAANTMNEE